MKHYLADLLTLTRLILAIILLVLAFTPVLPAIGFVIFILAELTDAFDGTLANKYPFPKNKAPKYRKHAAVYDMTADILLAIALAMFFIMRVNSIAGLIIAIGYTSSATIIELIIYGRLLGHPDTAKPNSLMVKNFPLAKKIVLTRRNIFLGLLFLVATWTLYASEWHLATKITITVIGVIISAILWIYLSQRRHNISRDAVDIEQKLAQKSHKKTKK